jgi:hypothetical protein
MYGCARATWEVKTKSEREILKEEVRPNVWTGFALRDFGLPLQCCWGRRCYAIYYVRLCIFLQLVPQTTNASIQIYFITFIKLLHVINCILCDATRRLLVALATDFSGQAIGSIFKGQFLDYLNLQEWADRLSRNVCNYLQPYAV